MKSHSWNDHSGFHSTQICRNGNGNAFRFLWMEWEAEWKNLPFHSIFFVRLTPTISTRAQAPKTSKYWFSNSSESIFEHLAFSRWLLDQKIPYSPGLANFDFSYSRNGGGMVILPFRNGNGIHSGCIESEWEWESFRLRKLGMGMGMHSENSRNGHRSAWRSFF